MGLYENTLNIVRFRQAGSPGPTHKDWGSLGSCSIVAHLHQATPPTSPPQLCSNSASLPGTPSDSLLKEIPFCRRSFQSRHCCSTLHSFYWVPLYGQKSNYICTIPVPPLTRQRQAQVPSHSPCTVLSVRMVSLKTGVNGVIWVPILYPNPKRTVATVHQRQKHRWRVGGHNSTMFCHAWR